jgi:ATP-dependent helicase HrpA
MGESLGGVVGYRTGQTKDMDDASTKCLVVTDGLAMVRRLMGHGRRHDILVLDEVHEWNKNIEILVAWCKRELGKGAAFKVVIMSASMESDKLAAYFGGAPILRLPGRMFPVQECKPVDTIERTAVELAREKRNVLVFQPGKTEINDFISEVSKLVGYSAIILPLHSELSAEDQSRCFRHYSTPKIIVSTNIAQTSVTIDDIDAVLDCGYEKRMEVIGGIEGLYLRPISLADRKQRKGRAGRTKPGVFYDFCAEPLDWRPEFPVAEIERTLLTRTVLNLALAGIDLADFELFHEPNPGEVSNAKRILKVLGCIDEELNVTELGHQIANLPFRVETASMIINGAASGVGGDVLSMAAIEEVKGITLREEGRYSLQLWRSLADGEEQADIIAQLNIFNSVWRQKLSNEEMRGLGVNSAKYRKALEHRKLLEASLRGKFDLRSSGDREKILRAYISGMVDNVYYGPTSHLRQGVNGISRQIGKESVVRKGFGSGWFVGQPFDLEIETRHGGKTTLNLLVMAARVDLAVLIEVAPHLYRDETGIDPYFDELENCVMSSKRVTFNQVEISTDHERSPDHPEAAAVFARWCASKMAA